MKTAAEITLAISLVLFVMNCALCGYDISVEAYSTALLDAFFGLWVLRCAVKLMNIIKDIENGSKTRGGGPKDAA